MASRLGVSRAAPHTQIALPPTSKELIKRLQCFVPYFARMIASFTNLTSGRDLKIVRQLLPFLLHGHQEVSGAKSHNAARCAAPSCVIRRRAAAAQQRVVQRHVDDDAARRVECAGEP